MAEKLLVCFKWDCGGIGKVEGIFIATKESLDNAFGKNIYFGEILGKHSEVYGVLEEKDITVVSKDQDKILWLEGILGTSVSGHNPLEHIE